jgi:hypothetical protein
VAWFLVALVLLFVSAPFVQMLPDGRPLEAALITLLLIAAVLAVGGRRQALVLALVLAAPVLAARWIHHFRSEDGPYKFYIAAFVVFIGFVVGHFLRFILRAPRVNSEVLCAAVSGYLLLGLLWASAYALVARLNPAAFSGAPAGQPLNGFDALYFSVITLATVGYGDIAPVSGPARMLAMVEAISGTMYVAVLVARLVALYAPHDPAKAGPSNSAGSAPTGQEEIQEDNDQPPS